MADLPGMGRKPPQSFNGQDTDLIGVRFATATRKVADDGERGVMQSSIPCLRNYSLPLYRLVGLSEKSPIHGIIRWHHIHGDL